MTDHSDYCPDLSLLDSLPAENASTVEATSFSPARPTPAPADQVTTLGDVLASIRHRRDLSDAKRREMISRLRTCVRIILNNRDQTRGRALSGRELDALAATLPCDPAWLNRHLFDTPPRVHELSLKSFQNAVSALRAALRHVGQHEPPRGADVTVPAESDWGSLLAMVRQARDQRSWSMLGGLASWCHARGVPPGAVTAGILAAYGEHLRVRVVRADIPRYLRVLACAWRQAAAAIPDWPGCADLRPARRQAATLRLGALSAGLQADVARLVAHLRGSTDGRGPFLSTGVPKPLRPRSVKHYVRLIREAASALVLLGRDPASLTRLDDLVQPEAAQAILQFYWDRAVERRREREGLAADWQPAARDGVCAQTGQLAHMLVVVARHFCCGLAPDQIARLQALKRAVTPGRRGAITAKNLDRLRQFDDLAVRARLLNLPETLMRRAEAMTRTEPASRRQAAQLARTAAAIEIELHIPLRISNLAGLHLGRDLKTDGGRGGRITQLCLTEQQTKNHHAVAWPVSPELAAFLERYIGRFRGDLAAACSPWLFPGRPGTGPISACQLSQHIVRAVGEEVGARLNPHLFRALMARLVLEHAPAALEDVRLLLGDKSMTVVLAHYSSTEAGAAARRQDARLNRLRVVAPATPQAARAAGRGR